MATTGLKIAEPITLKCGLTFPNRLSKAAMGEKWADKEALPTDGLDRAYEVWADGGWGMLMTGNVQVDVTYLNGTGDVALNDNIPREKLLASWKKWAKASSRNGTPTIMQLNHPGRQSKAGAGNRSWFTKNIAPSPIPLRLGDGLLARALTALVFGTPREMTIADIKQVVSRFVEASKLASEAGFAGVEIHAAHGYLFSQFLSPKSNQRTDIYGGSARNRARALVEVIEAVREAVPKDFCVAVKLNSADYQSEEEMANCIEQLEEITAAGVDFVEISGGTYEDPSMVVGDARENTDAQKSASTIKREAFFLDFAKTIRSRFRNVPLMVTGGFRTRQGMENALQEDACDIIGIARPAVLYPSLPKDILLNTEIKDADARANLRKTPYPWIAKMLGIRGLIGSTENVWYMKRMRADLK